MSTLSDGRPIYLDYNATTPVDPAVREAMLPYLGEEFGNPSSDHAYGQSAGEAVGRARRQVAELLGAREDEIVFTGGGSESDNLAVQGIAFAHRDRGRHIITSAVEHPAVLRTCQYLAARHGFEVTVLPVDRFGLVDSEAVERAIRPTTTLITIMHAQNEVGTVEPVAEIARIARSRGVIVHTDASQSAGKVPTRVDELGVDLLTVAGHKLYAPKGIGALYVRSGVVLDPLIHGAGHEGGRRAGTENVPYIVALGKACERARLELPAFGERLQGLRDDLFARLERGIPGLQLNGHRTQRLPNTLNVSVAGLDGTALLRCIPAIAASTGSACHSGATEPSEVLSAMGLDRAEALGALRLSLGRFTNREEVARAARLLVEAVGELRAEMPAAGGI